MPCPICWLPSLMFGLMTRVGVVVIAVHEDDLPVTDVDRERGVLEGGLEVCPVRLLGRAVVHGDAGDHVVEQDGLDGLDLGGLCQPVEDVPLDPFHVPVRSPASRRKASSFGRNAVSGSEPSARTLTGESESAFRTAVTAASRMS